MREFDALKEDNKIEIQSEQQEKKEIKLISSQRRIRGIFLWEFNTKDKTLALAEYKKVTFELKSLSAVEKESVLKHRVVIKDNCIYIQALNRKNALRKIKNLS